MDPLASAIVLLDRGRFEPAVPSLLAGQRVPLEVVAVIGDAPMAEPPAGPVRVIKVPDRNPARRRNLAAAEAKGRYLAFIDDDARAPEGWLARAVEFLESRAEYAGVGGPNLLDPDAPLGERISDALLATPVIGAGSGAYRPGGEGREAAPGELHLVNLVVRKEWFEKAGGLNEELGYGGEDTEFLHVARSMGARFYFEPGLWVYHRRRPFGVAYLGQRLRLRMQSARLFAAYPDVYLKSPAFFAALLAPLAAAALVLLSSHSWAAWSLAVLAIGYCAAAWGLSAGRWPSGRWWGAAPVLFAVHHFVYVLGLWFGLVGALFEGPGRLRSRIGRTGR